ncbi:MAG: LysR substrate-binding domain-containing protein, partial [Amaricoccus sp.]
MGLGLAAAAFATGFAGSLWYDAMAGLDVLLIAKLYLFVVVPAVLVGLRLFTRQHGRYAPTHAARDVFAQMQDVFRKIEDLQLAIGMVRRGASSVISCASVPSLSQALMPRAVALMRAKHPDLRMQISVLTIDEAIDYLLLRKGELVALSYKLDHPALHFHAVAPCALIALAPQGHPLAGRESVTAQEILNYPL